MKDLSERSQVVLVKKAATFSSCRNFRYSLSRTWDESLPRLTWILLNPSKADEHEDDPTIRRVIGLSRGWGYGSAHVLNLYARVCTCPTDLERNFTEHERIGPRNNRHLTNLSSPVIVAWGAHKFSQPRAQDVLALLPHPLFCISQNMNGSPKHPLYAHGNSEKSLFIPVSAQSPPP